jgi:hypothetical protein
MDNGKKETSKEGGEGCCYFFYFQTSVRNFFCEWGISDGLFIDGKHIRTGPPPLFKKYEPRLGRV